MDMDRLRAANKAAELVGRWQHEVKQIEAAVERDPLKDMYWFPEDPPPALWSGYHAQLLLWAQAKLREAQDKLAAV
jgi:hypothetical protein